MIDNFSLGLTHFLLIYAAWRLLSRPDLDSEDTGAYPSYMGMRWPDASDWRDLDRLVIAGPKSHLRRPKP